MYIWQVKRELRGFKVLQRIGKESIFEAQLEAIVIPAFQLNCIVLWLENLKK